MAKKCIVNRSPDDQIRFVGTPNPNQTDAVKLAISRNKGNPLSQTSKGEPSLLYNSYIELLGLSPEAAEKAVAEQFSDKFGRWFGRWWEPGNTNVSKVVDENGQPRIVWQGTDQQTVDKVLDGGRYQGYRIWGNEYNNFEQDGDEKNYRFSNTALFLEDHHSAGIYARGTDLRTVPEKHRKYIQTNILIPAFLNARRTKNVETNSQKIIPEINKSLSESFDSFHGMNANPDMGLTWSVADANQIQEISLTGPLMFQNETQSSTGTSISQEILREVTDVLLKKGLVSQVNLMTPQELRQVLEEMGLSEETMKQIEAWHGSPHRFDRFSTEYMGTGEGVQAFGWGLYFTDLKGIAEDYAKVLTKIDGVTEEILNHIKYESNKEKVIKSLEETRDILFDDKDSVKRLTEAINKVEKIERENVYDFDFTPNRNLYNVSLHQGKTPEQYNWLEWDKPLSEEQFEKIIIRDYMFNGESGIYGDILDYYTNGFSVDYNNEISSPLELIEFLKEESVTGKEIYNIIKLNSSLKEASLKLLNAGIDGIKYPAESISRGATSDNTRGFNYVVFDENAVTIQEVVQFQNELEKAGLKLVPNGFYRPSNRQIYLNSENPRILETTIHEFAHPFLQYLRDNKPAHYRAGVKLLETNSNEAQKYIDLVLRTQPSLKQGSQAFNEEVLAQIVGDNGAKLVGSSQNNSIQEWLRNLWDEISRMIGITQRTPEEISQMTLREFSDAVTAEMLDQKIIKNSTLTLAVLEQPHFTQMRGRSISPQTISNGVKGKGIKEIERQIITSVLAIPEFQTKKINYDNFELAVKAQLMPLKRIESDSYADHGSSEIDGKYDSTATMIYNSPLDHGITGHFTQDYRAKELAVNRGPDILTIDDIKFIDEDTGETVYIDPSGEFSDLTGMSEEEILKILDRENAVLQKKYQDDISKPQFNQGLFGHTRVWTKDDVYNVAEVQSDVFQSDRLKEISEISDLEFIEIRREKVKEINYEYNTKLENLIHPVTIENKTDFSIPIIREAIAEKVQSNQLEILENEHNIVRLKQLQDEVRNNKGYYELENEINRLERINYDLRFIGLEDKITEERYDAIAELDSLKRSEKILTDTEKQFVASEKSFELRLIRESIQDAANRGFKKLRLPLPYTLSKIEGYLNEGGQVEIEGEPEIGEYVEYLGASYRVVDYENDDIKIIHHKTLYDVDMGQYTKDWAYNEIGSILYDQFQDENVYSLDEIKSKLDQTELKDKTKYDIVRMLKEESEQTDEIDPTEYRDQMEEIFVENVSKSDLEEYFSDLDYSTVVFTKDRILYSQDEGEWVSYSNGSQDKESFSIDDLSEYHQPVARRYEYFGKLLEKERPGNVKVIDDENGYPWYETQILESDKNSPVLAFQAERSDQDRLIRTGLELGHEYDTDKVARERFDIPSLKRISSGSDRVVYEIDQNYVLKVAKTARGLEQNLHEGNDMLVREGLIPDVVEAGLNYVVVEKITPIKAKDLVPIYDTEGEQIGTERADRMFAELSRFRQADFELRSQKFLDTLYKYGMYDVTNHELLVGDFSRKSNWGIRDGRPIHIDAGTFAGESLLTDYAGKRNLDDPDFREIYERSREAKKLYGDRDTNTMFQIEDRNEKNLIKEKAIQNGTWMKAPNGKPTNLNEYQYLEVRTERFKKWFGDWENDPKNASKVVDENGEPRVMYTGTSKDKDFKKFNVPRNGAWFTSDPNEASMYAMDNDSKTVKIDSSGNYKDVNTASRVIPVFLNLKTIADFNQEVTPEQREKLKYANNYKKIQGDLFQNIYFSRPLGENRFDGIDYSGDGKVMVVLMNPNAIKSAIANTGEYSLDNNDIMFQISEVTQNQMIPSQLYEQLRQQPFVDSEQALEAYKNVYTDSVGDWQSTEFNC